ncbi:MAG: ArsR/SmtB family transcription factor [Thermodesulfobacteriota bacterium]
MTISAHADMQYYMKATAHIFKALSEPVRLRILALLIGGERCVCDLMEVLDLPQSTVSRHLATLRNAGWVEGERKGQWMYYRLAGNGCGLLQDLLPVLERQLKKLPEMTHDQDRLREYLSTKKSSACE